MKDEISRPLGWTTMEEGRRLVGHGINPKTADMYWEKSKWMTSAGGKVETKWWPFVGKKEGPDIIVECWSLGRLLVMLPTSILFDGVSYYLSYESHDGDFEIEYYSSIAHRVIGDWYGNLPVEVCVDTLVWLCENGFIENGGLR